MPSNMELEQAVINANGRVSNLERKVEALERTVEALKLDVALLKQGPQTPPDSHVPPRSE